MPNLIEVQKKSYQWFLDEGLREVFADTASITDYTGNLELSFLDYSMDEEPKYSVEECKARDATYASPLKVRMRLRNKETGEIKEQEIFMGDFPKIDRLRNLHHQRRGTRHRLPAGPLALACITAASSTRRTRCCSLRRSSRTAVRGWRTKPMPMTCFTSASIKTAKSRSRALSVPSALRTDAEIKELFGEDPLLLATLDKDPAHTSDEALIEIYKKMRPGEPPSVESATNLMDAMFFDTRRYDISAVGRYKYNKKLDIARRIAGHRLLEPAVDPMTGRGARRGG